MALAAFIAGMRYQDNEDGCESVVPFFVPLKSISSTLSKQIAKQDEPHSETPAPTTDRVSNSEVLQPQP